MKQMEADVLIIGKGMAGLSAAREAAKLGLSVLVVGRGCGATAMSSGAIDIAVPSGERGIRELVNKNVNHPYSLIGKGNINSALRKISASVKSFLDGMKSAGVPYKGSMKQNMLLTNALGTGKSVTLCPASMYPGDVSKMDNARMLFVGFRGFADFNPAFCSRSLFELGRSMDVGIKKCSYIYVDFPGMEGCDNIQSIEIARGMDDAGAVTKLASLIENKNFTHMALPVMGIGNCEESARELEDKTGAKAFEVLSLPPSVPGYRLQTALERCVENVQMINGKVMRAEMRGEKNIREIKVENCGEILRISPKTIVLATGKYIGGGLEGHDVLYETIFNLPTFDGAGKSVRNAKMSGMLCSEVLPESGHPVFSCGVMVDNKMHPLNGNHDIIFENLFAAGSVLCGYDYTRDNCGLGVALATGCLAGVNAGKTAGER